MKHLFFSLILILWSNAYCVAQAKPENPTRRTPEETNSSVKSISLVDAKVLVLPKNSFSNSIFATNQKYTPSINSNIVFYEDFDNVPGSTASGLGTYAFPNGWLLRNVDNKTPVTQVNYVNDAWERRDDFSNSIDSVAVSTSYYAPAGQADDWMWTPQIAIPANSILKWNALAYDGSFRDGYEVRVMAATPTGGTGNIGNQLSSTVIFSVASENPTWTAREVSLAAYAGQSIYIGFRNNSNDKFLLLIDDILVEITPPIDAEMLSIVRPSTYSKIPLSQATPLTFGGVIENNGLSTINNVALNVKVKVGNDDAGTYTSTAIASIAPGVEATFTFTPFTPMSPGVYELKYYPTLTQTDEVATNDTLTTTLEVSTNTYARHTGPAVTSLGIGNDTEGFLGSLFTITKTVALESVMVGLRPRDPSYSTKVRIYGTTAAGIPNDLPPIWESSIYNFVGSSPTVVNFVGPAIVLNPGTYLFGCVENENGLGLAGARAIGLQGHENIFTPNTQYVRFSGIPWIPLEQVGPAFNKTLSISPVFKCLSSVTQTANITSGIIEKIAANTISASNQISNAKVAYTAGKAIFLDPGFKAEGNRFTAQIGGCENTSVGLVAYYPFNGNANDETSSGNNGVVNGATLTTDRFGNPNKAYAFDGVDDFIRVTQNASLNSITKTTISFWTNLNQVTRTVDGFDWQAFVSKDTYTKWFTVMLCTEPVACGGQQPLILYHPGLSTPDSRYNWSSVSPNTWYHVTVSNDGAFSKFYINGVLVQTESETGSVTPNTSDIILGRCSDIASLYPLDGKLDDLRIYNRALSDAEVRAIYDSEKP